MADWPGRLCPPFYWWSTGMVVHVLKTDPVLRELEYVQVEAPGTMYLFFYDRHGCRGLMQNAVEMVCIHIADSLMEWIGWSAHFNADPIQFEEGQHLAMVAQERHRQCSRIQDIPNQPAHLVRETSSGSSLQLVGRAPPMPENQGGHNPSRATPAYFGKATPPPPRLRQPRNEEGGGSLPSSLEHPGGIDSDGQSTMSESDGDCRHRRH